MKKAFFTSKKFYILAVLVVVGVGIVYKVVTKPKNPIAYETATVEKSDIAQTVSAVGKVESVNDLSLRFEIPGTLAAVNVKEGDNVKAGQVLATLRLSELNAAVSQAAANLNQKLAPATSQDKNYYTAAVDQAKAALDQAKLDRDASVNQSQSAFLTALNNLKLAQGGDNSQIVVQTYETALTALQGAPSKFDDALTQADNILGIDNTFANDIFEKYLAQKDINSLSRAKNSYQNAKIAVQKVKPVLALLNRTSGQSNIDIGIKNVEEVNTTVAQLLADVSAVLGATTPVADFPQAELDARKTIIESTRASLSAQYSTLIANEQAISNAKNSYQNLSIVLDRAVHDLDQAKNTGANNIKIKEAMYNQAVSNLQTKVNPPREVDVAAYRAALAAAVASRDKAIMRAPIDGIVTNIGSKTGELVSSANAVINLLSPRYEIKLDLPETDVVKLKGNDPVEFTVDALGSDVKFTGKVIAADPKSTEIQGVVYYQISISIDDNKNKEKIKPGMTVNVTISTDSRKKILHIPLRAVKTNEDGSKYVEVLENNTKVMTQITLGLKGDGGVVEVLTGVSEGDQVVTGTSAQK